MYQTRQSSLYRAANAAGFATVWHDDTPVARRHNFGRIFGRLARFFG